MLLYSTTSKSASFGHAKQVRQHDVLTEKPAITHLLNPGSGHSPIVLPGTARPMPLEQRSILANDSPEAHRPLHGSGHPLENRDQSPTHRRG